MGRTYWFECSRCGYRAKAAGRADRGLDFFVQTIVCLDCKELYDAVTRLRVPAEAQTQRQLSAWRLKSANSRWITTPAPSFQAALNRLPQTGVKRFRWLHFKMQCPVSAIHRVEAWNDPDKCPRCGIYLEKNALPYRIWD